MGQSDVVEIDESEDSDSEFQLDSDSAQDEEDETVMLDVAVRMSLQTALRNNGAGSSSGDATGPGRAVVARAVAAERRLAKRRKTTAFVNRNFDEDEDEDDIFDASDSSSEEIPLSKGKSKLAGTVKSAKKVAPYSTTSAKDNLSTDKWQKSQTEHRRSFLSARRAVKKEQRAEVARLGRRLTHVSRSCFLHIAVSVISFPG